MKFAWQHMEIIYLKLFFFHRQQKDFKLEFLKQPNVMYHVYVYSKLINKTHAKKPTDPEMFSIETLIQRQSLHTHAQAHKYIHNKFSMFIFIQKQYKQA